MIQNLNLRSPSPRPSPPGEGEPTGALRPKHLSFFAFRSDRKSENGGCNWNAKTFETRENVLPLPGERVWVRANSFLASSWVTSCILAFLASLTSIRLQAAEPSASDIQFFENKIRPILADNCYKCHSHEAPKLKGGLSVEYREALLKGGDTGPAIVSGDPEKSLLIKAVRYTDPDLQMPPKKKLADDQIQDMTAWIKMGAPYPKASAAIAKAAGGSDKDHWSFKPILKYPVPAVKETGWVSTPIDNFILAKLEENGMKPSPMADKRTLIRRATFDLIGLAPTLKETQDFLKDESPEAFAKVVDRLLASPQYGERWGRYWLDTARYSDTKGEVKQNQEDFRYPFAWTYRDYVVRSFNDDKPFNRFVVEQIAADRLPLGEDRSSLAALGFLTLGDHFNGMANDIINDRIDVVCKGFLGLTVTCARCHDHKFDPIPTKDYYSLRGIFASCAEPKEEPILGKLDLSSPQYQEFAKKYNELNGQIDHAGRDERRRKAEGASAKGSATATRNCRAGNHRSRLASARDGAGGPAQAG